MDNDETTVLYKGLLQQQDFYCRSTRQQIIYILFAIFQALKSKINTQKE